MKQTKLVIQVELSNGFLYVQSCVDADFDEGSSYVTYTEDIEGAKQYWSPNDSDAQRAFRHAQNSFNKVLFVEVEVEISIKKLG